LQSLIDDPVGIPSTLSTTNIDLSAVRKHLEDVIRVSKTMIVTATSPERKRDQKIILNSAAKAKLALENASLTSQLNDVDFEPNFQAQNFKTPIDAIIAKWRDHLKSNAVELTSFVDPELPDCIFTDHDLLHTVINNFLCKAIENTAAGRIHLHIVGDKLANDQWNIKIVCADTGDGLTEDAVNAIIDGSSLEQNLDTADIQGYRTIARLENALNGTFKLVSKKGRGTEVSIAFPTRAATVFKANSRGETRMAAGRLNGKRILIVEDDLSSQDVLTTFLEPDGCQVHCISDGQHAIETLLAEPAFDLIFMDIRMNGMNGIETTKAIRKSEHAFSKVPIIAITADTSPETNAKAMIAGVDLFLTKPVSAKGLFEGISFVLDLQAEINAVAI